MKCNIFTVLTQFRSVRSSPAQSKTLPPSSGSKNKRKKQAVNSIQQTLLEIYKTEGRRNLANSNGATLIYMLYIFVAHKMFKQILSVNLFNKLFSGFIYLLTIILIWNKQLGAYLAEWDTVRIECVSRYFRFFNSAGSRILAHLHVR
jgi:uncharacterized membrane protein